MLVSVSDHIRGLCTTLHLADINLQHPEKKLKEGKVVKCRVSVYEGFRMRMFCEVAVFLHCEFCTSYLEEKETSD